MTRKKAIKN